MKQAGKGQKKVRVKMRTMIADYLKSLPKSELAALTKVCRKRGLNVRVDRESKDA